MSSKGHVLFPPLRKKWRHVSIVSASCPSDYKGSGYALGGSKVINGYTEGYLTYNDDSKRELLMCVRSAKGEITIPNSVIKIGENAFYQCVGVTKIDVPDSVTSIGDCAFQDCANLTALVIGENVKEIGKKVFYLGHNKEISIVWNARKIIKGSCEFIKKESNIRTKIEACNVSSISFGDKVEEIPYR